MNRHWMPRAAALLVLLGVLPAVQAQDARDPAHPFTIVVLSPAPTGPAADAARTTIEQAAKARGLPVSLVPLEVADASGVAIPDDVLLQSGRQLGGAAVLIGRADAANPGNWQWRLLTGHASPGWSGPLDAGVQGAADALGRDAQAQSGPVTTLMVTVQGVAGLKDYAAVSQLLAGLPVTQSAGIIIADGTAATFQLAVHGGAAALSAGLAGSRLAPVPGASGLTFQYRP